MNNSGKNGEFDNAGRLQKDLNQNYLWDLDNNLKEVKNASTSNKYFYDVNGIRILTLNFSNVATNTKLIDKLFTPNNFYQETDKGKSNMIYLGDKPIVNIESGTEIVTNMATKTKGIILDLATTSKILNLNNLQIGQKQNVIVNWGKVVGVLPASISVVSGKATIVPIINKNKNATSTIFSFTPFTNTVNISVKILPNIIPVNFTMNLKIASTTGEETISTSTKPYTKIYNLLTNHLNSIDKVVDFENGKVEGENSYSAYGKLASSTNIISNKKYTGHEDEQNTTGLIYMKGRYQNPSLGTFISPDKAVENVLGGSALLANPQTLNKYSYAWNNPINAHDPDGNLTVILPGTWYNSDTWNNNNTLYKNAQSTFGETPIIFNDVKLWTGGNNHNDRMLAGNNLADIINNYNFASGENLNIVGYSHGGNVAKIASHMLTGDRQISNLVTLGTPFRPDYLTNMSRVQNMTEIYSEHDRVQANGGNRYHLRAATGYIANRGRSPFDFSSTVYERGPANRFETQFTTKDNFGFDAHTQLYAVQSVWDFVFK